MGQQEFDVLVIGAGISGAALFYELARYTNIKNIALIEKYNTAATLNSKERVILKPFIVEILKPIIL